MRERVMDFIGALRSAGLSVSPAEGMDALRALACVDFADPGAFKAALRATLVKRSRDIPVFEELFPLYFYGLAPCGGDGLPDGELREALREEIARMEGREQGAASLLMMLMTGQGGEWETIIRRGAQGVGTSQLHTRQQIGMYTRRIFEGFDWEGAEEELAELIERLREKGWEPGRLEELRRLFEELRDGFRSQVRRYVEREQARRAGGLSRSERIKRLMSRPLSELDEAELQLMREAVYVLARRLRNKLALRERRGGRGRLDVKSTLRVNMRHGGIPFRLVLRKRKREKVELFVLCDVSSSVARVSQFMLRFVYTIQDCLARVRSFVFVDELGEVTSFFNEDSIEEGVRKALHEADIVYYARSDFGGVFRQFCDEYLQDVGYRTYILIIGDARNNQNDPCAEALERMARRARGIIWLNPEPRPFWDTGDSVMGEYLPHLKEARVCRNLEDLDRAVSSLLL
jgi:uncharacterized protein with von Willebrand factor type A (vWA) domain